MTGCNIWRGSERPAYWWITGSQLLNHFNQIYVKCLLINDELPMEGWRSRPHVVKITVFSHCCFLKANSYFSFTSLGNKYRKKSCLCFFPGRPALSALQENRILVFPAPVVGAVVEQSLRGLPGTKTVLYFWQLNHEALSAEPRWKSLNKGRALPAPFLARPCCPPHVCTVSELLYGGCPNRSTVRPFMICT